MNKSQKLVKGISWYFKLGKSICLIAAVAGILMALVMGGMYILGIPETFSLTSLEIGGLTFSLTYVHELSARPAVLYAAVMCLFASVAAVIEYKLHGAVCAILEPIREGRPFQDAVVHHTRRLGRLIIASGVTAVVTDTILGALLPGVIDLNAIFASEKIFQVTLSGKEHDISFIIYALVMFLLSSLFRQAAELQQLSDETL